MTSITINKLVLKGNMLMLLGSIVLSVLISISLSLGIYLSEINKDIQFFWFFGFAFSFGLIICAHLFHKIGREDGKVEGYNQGWKPNTD